METVIADPRIAEAWLAYREKAKNDVLFLAKEVLGYTDIDYNLKYHQQLAELAEHVGNTLCLAPRSFIKSTVITVAGTIQYILRFPEQCTLIMSSTISLAQDFLSEIAQHFVIEMPLDDEDYEGPRSILRQIYPELCPQKSREEPTTEKYCIPNRNYPRRENTVECCGIDGAVTGLHFERIVIDDGVHKDNVVPWATEDTMGKVWEHYRSVDALLKLTYEASHKKIVGTRWNDGDVYGLILKDPKLRAEYKTLVTSPWDDDGKLIWPKKFGEERLEKIRVEMGKYMWSCLMMQNPLPPDTAARFEEQWFHEYSLQDFEDNVNRFSLAITVDPAFQERMDVKSDRTAIALTGVPPEHGIYIVAIRVGKMTPHQIAYEVIAMWREYKEHIEWVGVEIRSIYNVIRELIEQEGLDIWLRELKPRGQRKDARVARLSAHAQRRGIFYHSGIDPEYINEILRYPVGHYRDIPDVLAYRAIELDEGEAPKEAPRPKLIEVPVYKTDAKSLLDRIEGNDSSIAVSPWSL